MTTVFQICIYILRLLEAAGGLHHGVSTHPSDSRLCMHKGDHLLRQLILPVIWLQVASIQAYQPTPSVLDYACTKVTLESVLMARQILSIVCHLLLHSNHQD